MKFAIRAHRVWGHGPGMSRRPQSSILAEWGGWRLTAWRCLASTSGCHTAVLQARRGHDSKCLVAPAEIAPAVKVG